MSDTDAARAFNAPLDGPRADRTDDRIERPDAAGALVGDAPHPPTTEAAAAGHAERLVGSDVVMRHPRGWRGVSEKKKLNALTALRFFAAAMVVLTHAHPIFGSFGIANAAPLGQGVSFFFVLSGFILTYNYPRFENAIAVRTFFVARFARIWPLHAVTCLLWIFLIFGLALIALFVDIGYAGVLMGSGHGSDNVQELA